MRTRIVGVFVAGNNKDSVPVCELRFSGQGHKCCHSVALVYWHAMVFPANANVYGQPGGDAPVILHIGVHELAKLIGLDLRQTARGVRARIAQQEIRKRIVGISSVEVVCIG